MIIKTSVIFCLTAAPCLANIGVIDVNSGPPAEVAHTRSSDKSALWLKSGTRMTILMLDPLGKRTGVDPKTFQVLRDIPDSSCDVDFIPNTYTGEEHAEAQQRITLDPIPKGTYTLLVHGLQEGPYEITISALSRNGSSEPSKEIEGLISEGEEKVLKLSYDPAPNSSLAVVEPATKN